MPFTGPAGDPRWGAILQDPNLETDFGGPQRARALWMTRQAETTAASQDAMSQLAAALKAARDKQMADLAAADALKNQGGGGGGGGRGGGGSGAVASTLQSYQDTSQPWLDAYLQQLGANQAPPTYDGILPSNLAGFHDAQYRNPVPTVAPKPVKVSGTGASGAPGTGTRAQRLRNQQRPYGIGVLPKKPAIAYAPSYRRVLS